MPEVMGVVVLVPEVMGVVVLVPEVMGVVMLTLVPGVICVVILV